MNDVTIVKPDKNTRTVLCNRHADKLRERGKTLLLVPNPGGTCYVCNFAGAALAGIVG